MPKAYSYLRFSTAEQRLGHSFERQQQAAVEYAAKHGLDLDTSLTFQDLGVSAFKGKNLSDSGQLKAFLRAVEEGIVPAGSFLLVENLDRISREDAYTALGTVQSILGEGITLVSLQTGKVYSKKILQESPWPLMEMFMDFVRANDESATKSKRLRAAWGKKKRQAAEQGIPLTKQTPAWIVLRDGEYHLVRSRADIVRRIFRETLQGVGQHTIAENLNDDGVPVFGRGKHWHRSYIVKVVRNPAVMGVYVPHTTEHEGHKKKRRPGEPVFDYYPAAVDAETFNAAQAIVAGKTTSPRRGKHAASDVQNVFGGLIRCHRCDSTVTRVAKGDRSKPYLVCTKAKAGAGCKYEAIPYATIEGAFVDQLDDLCRDAPTSDADAQEAIEANETAISEATERLQRALRSKGKASSQAMQKLIAGIEADLVELEAERTELANRAALTNLAHIKKRLHQLRDVVRNEKIGWRTEANVLLRQLFKAVVLTPSKGDACFVWLGGRETSLSFFTPDR